MAGTDRGGGLPAATVAVLDLAERLVAQYAVPDEIDHDEVKAFADAMLDAAGPVITADAARRERQRICDKLSRYGLDNPDWMGVLEVVTDLIEEGT